MTEILKEKQNNEDSDLEYLLEQLKNSKIK